MASQMNRDASTSTSPYSSEDFDYLKKKVEQQAKTIQQLSDTIYRTNSVLIDIVEGLFCHQSQQHILHKHLSELSNNRVNWEPETNEDTNVWGALPTTFQGNDHEFRIVELENIIDYIIQDKKLSSNRSDEPYIPLLSENVDDGDGSLDSEIVEIYDDINKPYSYKSDNLKDDDDDTNYKLTVKSFRISESIDLLQKLKYQHETKLTILSDLKEIASVFYPESVNKYPAYFKRYDIELDKTNTSIDYRCDKVDEFDKLSDHIIMDNQVIDSMIKDLKQLLKKEHPECLSIYESSKEPYAYL